MGNNAGTRRQSLSFHKGHCLICKSIHIDKIEELYVRWYLAKDIAELIPELLDPENGGYSNVEQFAKGLKLHGVATGIYTKRLSNIREANQRIIEAGMELGHTLTPEERKLMLPAARELETRVIMAQAKAQPDKHLHMSAGDMTEEQIERFINAGHEQIVADKAVNVADDQPTEEGVGQPPAGGVNK